MIVTTLRDQATHVILDREGERQAQGCGQGHDVLEVGLDQKRNDDREPGDPDQQPRDGCYPQDQQPAARRRALGGAMHNPAHRQNEQTAADRNEKDDKDMAPGQFSQEAETLTGFIHDFDLPNPTVSGRRYQS